MTDPDTKKFDLKRDFSGTNDLLKTPSNKDDILKVLQPQRYPSHSNAAASGSSKVQAAGSEPNRKKEGNPLIVKKDLALMDCVRPTDSGFESFMIPANSEMLKPPSVICKEDQQEHESGTLLNAKLKNAQKNFLRPKEVNTKQQGGQQDNDPAKIVPTLANQGSFLRSSRTNTAEKDKQIDGLLDQVESYEEDSDQNDKLLDEPQFRKIMHSYLAQYETNKLQEEARPQSEAIEKAIKRMTYDYMNMMVKEQGKDSIKIPFFLRLKQIQQQLLIDEFQLAYWNAVNISCPEMWRESNNDIFWELMLVNALFTKIHCGDQEECLTYRAFAAHNYPQIYNIYFQNQKPGLQQHWLTIGNRSFGNGNNLQNDPRIGLKAMRETFQSLFYKVPSISCAGQTANFGSESIANADKSYPGNAPLNYVDHPADKVIDYNAIVDFLEEEHQKRDVFTLLAPNHYQSNKLSSTKNGNAEKDDSVQIVENQVLANSEFEPNTPGLPSRLSSSFVLSERGPRRRRAKTNDKLQLDLASPQIAKSKPKFKPNKRQKIN